ncbi:MAG: hypothetical protein ABFC24_12625 [Methanoregulaceae archaeon]
MPGPGGRYPDAGTWNLVVINPDGQEGTNASVKFTVTRAIPAPVVTGISPAFGANNSATPVTITGTLFNSSVGPIVNLTRTGYSNITLTGTNLTGISFHGWNTGLGISRCRECDCHQS